MRPLCAFVPLLLLFYPFAVREQTANGSISGPVTDPSKAATADAKVAAANLGTNFRYETATNGAGESSLANLPPGTSPIEVERSGFKKLMRPDVILHAQDRLAIDFEMAVGCASDSVRVEAGAPLVNTTSGLVNTVLDQSFVQNLPLNVRSVQTLIMLTPGVVVTQTALDDQGQFSVNGQRADANYFTVDAVSSHFGGYSPHATATIGRGINNNLLLWSTVPNPSKDRVGSFSSSLRRRRNMGELDRRSVIGLMRMASVQRNAENQQQSLQENGDSGQWWVQPWPPYLGS